MKKLSKETSYNLRTGFGTLVSNQSCIEAGKSLPWWIAIILGLVATFIPVIPMMVNISKTTGETFINATYNYSFDKNGTIANVQLKNKGVDFVVDENHYLTYTENGTANVDQATTRLTEYVDPLTNQYTVVSYWLKDTEEKNVDAQYQEIISKQYIIGGTAEKSDSDPEGTTYYVPTYIFYYKEGNALYLANSTILYSYVDGSFSLYPGLILVSVINSIDHFCLNSPLYGSIVIGLAFVSDDSAAVKTLFSDKTG